MKYLQRRVLLLLCSVIEGCCSDSLSGVAASGSHWRKKKKKGTTKINHFVSFTKNIICIVAMSLCTSDVYLEGRNVQACLKFEEV